MTTHTPGPWNIEAEDDCHIVSGNPEGNGFYSIAKIYGPDSKTNARLIAAAPDMLTALQALVSDILEYEHINNLAPNPGKQDCWQSVTQARAAIAKATGDRS